MGKFSLATAMSIEDSLRKVLNKENVKSTFYIYVKDGEVIDIDRDVTATLSDDTLEDMVEERLSKMTNSELALYIDDWYVTEILADMTDATELLDILPYELQEKLRIFFTSKNTVE